MKLISWFLLIGAVVMIIQQRRTISSQENQIMKLGQEAATQRENARSKEIDDAVKANTEARKKQLELMLQEATACDTPDEERTQMLVDGRLSPSRLKMILRACEALPLHTDIRFRDDH